MTEIDMTQFIVPKSDQLNAESFLTGPKTYTVAAVTANEGNAEQPINIRFEGEKLVFRPCKTMRRLIAAVWGPRASAYIGQSMTLYRDPKVQWGGMEVGGIRISHMTGLDAAKSFVLSESKTKRRHFKVEPLKVEASAPAPKEDRAVLMANALIDRARTEDLDAFEADPKVIEQRAWLAKKRPDLSAQVDAAILHAATLEGAE